MDPRGRFDIGVSADRPSSHVSLLLQHGGKRILLLVQRVRHYKHSNKASRYRKIAARVSPLRVAAAAAAASFHRPGARPLGRLLYHEN